MTEHDDEDPDRAAILARRRAFIVKATAGLERSALAGRTTKLMALTVSGLATACPRPCLNDVGSTMYPPEESGTGETSDPTDTGTTTDPDTGTDETGSSQTTK